MFYPNALTLANPQNGRRRQTWLSRQLRSDLTHFLREAEEDGLEVARGLLIREAPGLLSIAAASSVGTFRRALNSDTELCQELAFRFEPIVDGFLHAAGPEEAEARTVFWPDRLGLAHALARICLCRLYLGLCQPAHAKRAERDLTGARRDLASYLRGLAEVWAERQREEASGLLAELTCARLRERDRPACVSAVAGSVAILARDQPAYGENAALEVASEAVSYL